MKVTVLNQSSKDKPQMEITVQRVEPQLWEMFEKQAKWTRQVCDERFTTVFMRKMGAFYVKGERGAAAFKERFFSAQNPDEVLEVAKEAFCK